MHGAFYGSHRLPRNGARIAFRASYDVEGERVTWFAECRHWAAFRLDGTCLQVAAPTVDFAAQMAVRSELIRQLNQRCDHGARDPASQETPLG